MSEKNHQVPRHPGASASLAISVARIMRLRPDPEDPRARRRVVAQVEVNSPSGQFSVFGQSAANSEHEENQAKGTAWRITEALLDKVVGVTITPTFVEGSGLAELANEAAMATVSSNGVRHYDSLSPLERYARGGVNVIKNQPFADDPARNPATLIGARALRVALEGALAHHRDGRSAGEVDAGNWFTADFERFYVEHLSSVERYATAPRPKPPEIDGKAANTFSDAKYIEPLPKDGTKGHLLEREALRYGLSSTRFPNGTFVVSDSAGRRMNFKWGRSPIASGVALSICSYKEATRRLLRRANVSVPLGRVFSVSEMETALDYADRIGYPVVCKPVAGLRGIGVVSDIRSREALVQALELYKRSELGNDDFVIEEHVPGEDYRIVVIGDEVVAAVVREPASVVGDGVHTIADLIEYKNRARLNNPHLSSRLIKISDSVKYQLELSGQTLGSVPPVGEKVLLANSANLSQGGDSFEVGQELHPTLREAAVRAVRAVPGLGFCGLDMLIEDHRKPLDEQRATVIELNAHAAIGSAQYPMWGEPSPVARRFFQSAAKAYGIPLPAQPANQLSVEIVVRGRVVGVGYRRWLRQRARRFGVNGVVANTGPRRVTARLQGDAEAVSALVYLAAGGPRKSLPSSVTTTHVTPTEMEGFTIEYQQLIGRGSWLADTIRRLRRALKAGV